MFELDKNQKKYLSIASLGLTFLYINKKFNNVSKDKEFKLPFYNLEKENRHKQNNKNHEIFISESDFVKIRKLKELNYLSSRLLNIIEEIPSNEIKKPDVILINSIKLLMDSIKDSVNQSKLNETIKIFIEINKKDKILSYNNILSGEILSYLASL